MASRPKMPVPEGDLTPPELCARIRNWAESHGYEFELTTHASEFGKVKVRDPAGGFTGEVIPNPHHGKRLRKDQVRFVIRTLNNRWKD
jgi:hypothetical protein